MKTPLLQLSGGIFKEINRAAYTLDIFLIRRFFLHS